MARANPFKNPFYVVLVVVGVVFLITAFSYGLMAYGEMPGRSQQQADSGLLLFLNQYGMRLLIGELAVLIAASIAAMATDSLWNKKPARSGLDASDGDSQE